MIFSKYVLVKNCWEGNLPHRPDLNQNPVSWGWGVGGGMANPMNAPHCRGFPKRVAGSFHPGQVPEKSLTPLENKNTKQLIF